MMEGIIYTGMYKYDSNHYTYLFFLKSVYHKSQSVCGNIEWTIQFHSMCM